VTSVGIRFADPLAGAQWLYALPRVCYAGRSSALGISRYAHRRPLPSPYIRIRASGRLGAGDYDRFEPKFAAELKRRQVPISGVLDCPPDTLRAPLLLLDIGASARRPRM
jgi:hypothetical protein